jgi:hypothetical protein
MTSSDLRVQLAARIKADIDERGSAPATTEFHFCLAGVRKTDNAHSKRGLTMAALAPSAR